MIQVVKNNIRNGIMYKYFSIGEMAKLHKISIHTLRYYDEIDLFKPSYVNKDNKYRYYTLDQFQYLETITYLKELGLSLDRIKYHLSNGNVEEVINSLEEQNNIIKRKINELEIIKQKINNKILQIKDSTRSDLLGIIREVEFDNRHVIQLKNSIKTYYDLELSLRKLTKMSEKKISLTYGIVGVSISKENLKKRQFKEYKSIFVMIEEGKHHKELIKEFPKGIYVCMRFNGTHEDAQTYYEKLIDYIREKGYEIIDDSLEMELVDPSLSLTKSEIVTELQILVKNNKHY